ncbi:hypothetical protein N5E68_05635 [Pseudomonas sp. GD03722]|nr:hypothetical protein [Pseudomonas sp. GD03722]MDH1441382.1 hypothetical protein [Pseudomonas sp. GD03722]
MHQHHHRCIGSADTAGEQPPGAGLNMMTVDAQGATGVAQRRRARQLPIATRGFEGAERDGDTDQGADPGA